jgi:hypothetical protein
VRSRVITVLLASAISVLLVSCASTRGDLQLDWQALERQQSNSAPLGLFPEAELFQARIILIQVQATTIQGTGADKTVRTTFPTAPFGISCGNGLSMDTEGNLFLDLVSLLKLDNGGTYQVTFARNQVVKTAGMFQYRPFAALSSDVTVSTGGGLMIRNGPIEWGYTIEGSTYRYKAPVPLLAKYDMSVDPDSITIIAHKLIPVTHRITLKEGEIHFPGKYKVSKHGDTYTIRTDELFSREYKLYYAANQVLFCEGDNIVKNVQLQPGRILVNGEMIAEYQRGS